MIAPWWLLSIGAGIASAALYGTIPATPLGAAFVAVLIAVPLFMAGLGLGSTAAALAAATGILAATALFGSLSGSMFALCFAAPAAILVRQALLSRKAGDDTEWYTAGLLIATLTVIGMAVAASFTAPAIDVVDIADRWLEGLIRGFAESSEDLTADQVMEKVNFQRLHRLLPGIVATGWMVSLMAGAAIAQAGLEGLGRNLRPSPDFAGLELPHWIAAVAAAAMVAALVAPAPAGAYAVSMAFAAAFPFLVQGLAVVHAFIRKIEGGTILLVIFYLLVFGPVWPVLLVVLLGAVEQFAGFRRGWKNKADA